MKRRWLITGVSSGLGEATMRAVIAHGDTVVGTLRTIPETDRFADAGPGTHHIVRMDVTDPQSVADGVQQAADLMGGIDVVMNNAGAGMFGPVEVCSIDDFRKMMEVNYFGPIAVTKAALPLLRQSRGTLINVSSMAGIITMDGTAPYAASKHAILGATTALREELAPLGVRVVCVLPGGFRSAFWSDPSNTIRSGGETVYDSQPAGHIFEQTRSHVGNEMGDPAKFGKLMIDIAGHSNPPAHLMVGADALDFVEMKRADLSRQLQDNADLSRTTDFAT